MKLLTILAILFISLILLTTLLERFPVCLPAKTMKQLSTVTVVLIAILLIVRLFWWS